jgi:3-deoxy-D-manno-octulosonic-acid transferase
MSTRSLPLSLTLYNAAAELAGALLVPLLAGTGKRRGWHLDERKSLPEAAGRPGKPAVWIHAASLGEAKMLDGFLDILERRDRSVCFVLTATSASGVGFLSRIRRPSVIARGFLPLDTLRLMKSFVAAFNVSRLWLVETELWPAMLWSCLSAGVPIGIVNGRIEEKSFSRYRLLRPLFSPLMERLEVVLAQNETYAARFRSLGVATERLHVTGNLKAGIAIRKPDAAERAGLRSAMRLAGDDVVITAGCFHKGEAGVLRDALRLLRQAGRACRCVVVPRHLTEADAIAAELGSGTLRLRDCSADAAWDVCTVEKIGILESLYRIADAAIVGGTFIDIGGHNVWEPAQFGIPVFFGPRHYEQQAGCDELLAAGVGFAAADAAELARALESALWTGAASLAAAAARFSQKKSAQPALEQFLP